jgi:cell wall assembly regulator SMI1
LTNQNLHTLKEAYQQLVNCALLKIPNLSIEQNAPATKAAINDLENLINKKLPQQFVELYLITDGHASNSVRLFNGLRLLSIAEISQVWLSMKDIKASGAFMVDGKEILAEADEQILSDWWNEGWVPITDNMSGDYTILDLAPNTTGTYGQIIQYWHDTSHRTLEATSLENWILVTAKNIEDSISKYNKDYEGFIEF